MTEKKGKLLWDKNKKKGNIETEDGVSYFVNTESFLYGVLSDGEEVYFTPHKNNRGPIAKDIQSEWAVYFKTNVLDLENCDYDDFCDKTCQYAKILKEGDVTTSKIRKVYDQIHRAKTVREIKKLRPQFAYIAGRNQDKPRVKELMNILDDLAKNATEDSKSHLQYIQQFMEAVVAYLKFAGDTDRK